MFLSHRKKRDICVIICQLFSIFDLIYCLLVILVSYLIFPNSLEIFTDSERMEAVYPIRNNST
ncbi:hypothetical protein ADIS_1177 [Lunatimonas lonarensis]|uniref:Uncharacterized protein n=1 Tax=Lunatimonas lonarensis TaxID=1232681 RepID=R7ZWD7_9BACT|nr:hypothetical protein ADIS_1177 [Lunatimonas lonarensis]